MRRVLLCLGLMLLVSPVWAISLVEQGKIEQLLAAIDDTPGLIFVTDGEQHDGLWAQEHLAFRLKMANPAISTAREFISSVASVSPAGNRYTLKFPDGKLADCGEWLNDKLEKIEINAATPAMPPGATLTR